MSKPRILIVDDEPANVFLLTGLLKANGYETFSATNGQQCMEFLNTLKPDLILLDIMMPKMTGNEILDKIMESDELKIIPVIMVTAKTSVEDVSESLNKGAIDYIRKPFNEQELLARVKVGIRLKINEDHLREMVEQRNAFVRIISHDLRSPFTAINGFAEILIQDKNITEDQKESLNYIIDSVQYSVDYFNRLLSWTMLESKDISLNIAPANVYIMVDRVCKLFDKNANQKSIRLISNIDKNLMVNVDETFFRQVIANLVNNAIKYTPVQGLIEINSIVSDKIYLIISDSGIGLPGNITNDDLFSGDINKSEKGTKGEKGTGIGLSICKKIIDAHSFKISFKRRNEGGTEFIIEI